MKIKIKGFYSIKNVEFEIEKGLTIIAGKNGCGKSQFLLALAQTANVQLLPQLGYTKDYSIHKGVALEPPPSLILYRQAVRNHAQNDRQNEIVNLLPLNQIININNKYGYTENITNRFIYLYTIVANIFLAGTNEKASKQQKSDLNTLTASFENVFSKTLDYIIDPRDGMKVGLKLPNGQISSFNTLSTGELEFISLLSDLIIEKDDDENKTADVILIDEIDSHFHPDLQLKIINEIDNMCKNKFVIISTHSPAVMLSVPPNKLFYLKHFSECKIAGTEDYSNQIDLMSTYIDTYNKMHELNKAIYNDLTTIALSNDDRYSAILYYASECEIDKNTALDANTTRNGDPQIITLKDFIMLLNEPTIVEIGCGKGRTLEMFNDIDADTLSGINYVGIDTNLDNLPLINDHAKKIGLVEKLNSFNTTKSAENIVADCCIFCNIFHEVFPHAHDFLNMNLRILKPNSKAIFLEVLSLEIGEKGYVMFHPEAFKELFKTHVEKGFLTCKYGTPKTYNGKELLNVYLNVIQPDKINISALDVVNGLNKVIEIETKTLRQKYGDEKILSTLDFAFRTHNLANAIVMKDILSQQTE